MNSLSARPAALFTSLLLPLLLSSQTFQEISYAAGIEHTFEPEASIGGGVAFFDYDNDGDDDLYLNTGIFADRLYQNNGNGEFTDVAFLAGLGLTAQYYTTSVVTGDIDNDGFRDIFVGTWNRNGEGVSRSLLYKNNGNGTFIEMGNFIGVTDTSWTIGASFLDVNLDGYLDLYTTNYVADPGAIIVDGQIVGFSHGCYENKLWLNNGDLSFTDANALYQISGEGCSLASLGTDYDQDGDIDIFLINDFGEFVEPNYLFQNQFPATGFIDVATSTGASIGFYGMGIAQGDYNLDGHFDYYITNLGRNALLRGDGTNFTEVAVAAGVGNTNTPDGKLTTSWGASFLDIDHDGDEDLFVANGRIPAASFIATSEVDPNKLFFNNQDGTFTDISQVAGIDDPKRSRGMACSDIDNDGDLDIMVLVQARYGDTAVQTLLYRNELGNDRHWVKIKLTGVQSNRDAYGAKIRCFAGEKQYIREIHGGSGHASQNSSTAHFGLGENSIIDSMHINWPGGNTQKLYDLAVDQTYAITEEIIALPQQLISFSGKVADDAIDLNWLVANEYDTRHYILQRSIDPAKQFIDLATINARNKGQFQAAYNYTDNMVTGSAAYYYRLKIVESRGEHHYSKLIAIRLDDAAAPALKLYPNPARDFIYIVPAGLLAGAVHPLRIWSAGGQLVYHKNHVVQNPVEINVSDFPKGMYFIKMGTLTTRFMVAEQPQ